MCREEIATLFRDTAEASKLDEPLYVAHEFAAFGVAVRKHSMRLGVASYPFPGLPSVVWCPKQAIIVVLVDMHVLVDEGSLLHFEHVDQALDANRYTGNNYRWHCRRPTTCCGAQAA